MKFLIQEITEGKIHDFSRSLLNSIEYLKWVDPNSKLEVKFELFFNNSFSDYNLKDYCPVGSVEFVNKFYEFFYGEEFINKPINVPECLFEYANREIKNIVINSESEDKITKSFVKSNDVIKSPINGIRVKLNDLPKGNYQISDYIDIDSEYRCFIYKSKLVGIKHYSGDFKIFPNIETIEEMIKDYDFQPISYTLDVGISNNKTFIIEVHDFFSCGLYGFEDHYLPNMFYKWHLEHIEYCSLIQKINNT